MPELAVKVLRVVALDALARAEAEIDRPQAERKAGNVPMYWVGVPPPPNVAARRG